MSQIFNQKTMTCEGLSVTNENSHSEAGGCYFGMLGSIQPNSRLLCGTSPAVSKTRRRASCIVTNATYAGFSSA